MVRQGLPSPSQRLSEPEAEQTIRPFESLRANGESKGERLIVTQSPQGGVKLNIFRASSGVATSLPNSFEILTILSTNSALVLANTPLE